MLAIGPAQAALIGVSGCAGCATDPPRTDAEWKYVFPRMKKHMGEAGLIDLGQGDESSILGFLARHSVKKWTRRAQPGG